MKGRKGPHMGGELIPADVQNEIRRAAKRRRKGGQKGLKGQSLWEGIRADRRGRQNGGNYTTHSA